MAYKLENAGDGIIRSCKKCEKTKLITEFKKSKKHFFGYTYICKECYNLQERSKLKDRNKERARARKYYKNNKEKVKAQKELYFEKNKDHIRSKRNEYERNRRKIDVLFRLQGAARARIRGSLRERGFKKNTKAMKLLGCTASELKTHLEKQFKDKMNWGNYGEWHIDHIIPLATAVTEEQIHKLCHYTNLQPLWGPENQSKGAKLL